MNIKKGLFRIWVIASALFLIFVAMLSYEDAAKQTRRPRAVFSVPIDCSKTKGELGFDYVHREKNLCWYDLPRFRMLFPEYNDLRDNDLLERLTAKAGFPVTQHRPWKSVAKAIPRAMAISILTLMLGYGLFWAVAGFRSTKPH